MNIIMVIVPRGDGSDYNSAMEFVEFGRLLHALTIDSLPYTECSGDCPPLR